LSVPEGGFVRLCSLTVHRYGITIEEWFQVGLSMSGIAPENKEGEQLGDVLSADVGGGFVGCASA
jgi:hypothetical protein